MNSTEQSRILFVDDDAFFSMAHVEFLRDTGFDVVLAGSTSDAILEAENQIFDLIILDIMMPYGEDFDAMETAGGYKTGIALARRLRDILPESKILALTHSNDPEVVEWFTRDDSVMYLNKSSLPIELARSIRQLLAPGESKPRVFIVHGRDHDALLELKDFLQNRLGFDEPMVLSNMPSRGLTLIEKFEHYAASTDLVFVLLTPDDLGSLAKSDATARPRPRMNVVFEYGYFLGTLHRKTGRVFLLSKGHLEIPTDIAGIVYIDISDGILAVAETIRTELEDWL